MAYRSVKGMNDILAPEIHKWAFVEKRARGVFERHGYSEVRTPMLEHTELFVRSIGEATDVVSKEMYTFEDRDGSSLTLRPEGTAACVRAYLEHSVGKREPVTRWYYAGPMFRRERAQRGRYRQFYQLGVEAFGMAEPSVDAEQIAMLYDLFAALEIPDLSVEINSVGTSEDRPAYLRELVAYLEPHRAELCADCQRRLEKNPLRVLDCKNPSCQALLDGAPRITDHLGEASRAHFDGVRRALDALGVPYAVNPKMVRGLDYYTGTTYEVLARGGDLGAQNTLGAGGRYDGLVKDLGGSPTPAVGFALGIERVILSLTAEPESYRKPPDVFLATLGEPARAKALGLARSLRARGFHVEVEHRDASVKSQLKHADRLGARTVLVLGEREVQAGQIVLRDMQAGAQRTLADADLYGELKKLLR